LNASASFVSIHATAQQCVVIGLGMTQMGDHSKANRVFIELFRRCTATNPSAVCAASEFGDRMLAVGTAGKQLTDSFGKSGDVLLVSLSAE
jgi:hypothetical protein